MVNFAAKAAANQALEATNGHTTAAAAVTGMMVPGQQQDDSPTNTPTPPQVTTKLAVTSLLHRFREVLVKYVEDERLSGKCPLPR